MASQAFAGVGTTFSRSDMGSSPTFTPIAEITGIEGPDKSRGTIDVTSLDSEDGYREFIGGFRDGGTIELEMNYTEDGYDDMNDDYESEDRVDYQIALPNGVILTFSGLVVNLGMAIPLDDKVSAPVSIKISGKVNKTNVT